MQKYYVYIICYFFQIRCSKIATKYCNFFKLHEGAQSYLQLSSIAPGNSPKREALSSAREKSPERPNIFDHHQMKC